MVIAHKKAVKVRPKFFHFVTDGIPRNLCSPNIKIAMERSGAGMIRIGDCRGHAITENFREVELIFERWMERFEAKLSALRDATQETTILGKRQGDQAIYLAVIEGPQNVRYSAQAGDLKPLHASSIGKALLSALNPADRQATVARLRLDARTPATITDRAALLADLDRCAARGVAETSGENVPDVMAIAKPVRMDDDLFAIAVAGPMPRMMANIDRHKAQLVALCADIAAPT